MQAAQDKSWQMNAIDLSQTMRGLANMRLGSRLLVQALVHRAATILDTFNPQVWPTHCQPALLLLVCRSRQTVCHWAPRWELSRQAFFGFNFSGRRYGTATVAQMAVMHFTLSRSDHALSPSNEHEDF